MWTYSRVPAQQEEVVQEPAAEVGPVEVGPVVVPAAEGAPAAEVRVTPVCALSATYCRFSGITVQLLIAITCLPMTTMTLPSIPMIRSGTPITICWKEILMNQRFTKRLPRKIQGSGCL